MSETAKPAIKLAEGMDDYVARFRGAGPPPAGATPPSPTGMLLNADLMTARSRPAYPAGMEVATTFAVTDDQEVAVRIYHPGRDVVRPAICFAHGGGWSMGSLESFDIVALGLAKASDAVVVSVHYRRIPKSSYKLALEDMYTAFVWLHEHARYLNVDPDRIALAGDSAGGFMATQTAILARDRGGPRAAVQMLMYPVTDDDHDRPYFKTALDPLLTGERIGGIIKAFNEVNAKHPPQLPAPLKVESLADLPPAVFVASEYDPLFEQAELYAERLREAGVKVDFRTAPGQIHGFMRGLDISASAREEMDLIAKAAKPYLWG